MKFLKNFKDPKINRVIGYVMLFTSFLFLFPAIRCEGVLQLITGAVFLLLMGGSVVWMIMKVRCPHCGALLHLKLYSIRKCPYCGEDTDPD